LVSRFVAVFGLSLPINLKRSYDNKFTLPMQLVMAWSGLRGAVAYALASTVPQQPALSPPGDGANSSLAMNVTSADSNATSSSADAVTSTDVIVATTHAVIIFTTLVIGGSIGSLLTRLRLSNVPLEPRDFKRRYLHPRAIEEKFGSFDKRFMIPTFSKLGA